MNLKISRILHAGYVFEHAGTQIAFDPIFENPFSRNCHAFPDVRFDCDQIRKLKFAAAFISHYHDDHCSFDSLDLLDRATPIYVYCIFEELFAMIRELGFTKVYALEINVPVSIGSIEVIPRRALDADVDSMFHVKAAGLNILNVVDSWIDPGTLAELQSFAPWDMVLWPFQTMLEIDVIAPSRASAAPGELPPEWIEQLQALKPKYVVPSSCQFVLEDWSWYNRAFFPISYRQFQEQLAATLPELRVVRMNPGVSVELQKDSLEIADRLSWIVPVGPQDVDYSYDKDLRPPPTVEVARHFETLTAEQSEKVFECCRQGLVEKYNSMDPPLDPYFEKPRLWRLSIYDHRGDVMHFYHRIDGGKLELATESTEPISWSTELPLAKFYAALELGESLTSMYVRINDMIFEPEIEKEIQAADVVEDPLVRCLFNGIFGAYQAAQLKRLLARPH